MSPEIINIVAAFLFILLVILYVMLVKYKTRKLEELDRERLRERTCRKCDNFMVEIYNETGSQNGYRCTGRFSCFIDRKEVKPFQKACKQYKKRIGED